MLPLLGAFVGCLAEPRNNESVLTPSAVSIGGVVPWATDPFTGRPGADVFTQFSPDGSNWLLPHPTPKSMGVVTANTTSTPDPAGNPMFGYSGALDLGLPLGWSGSLSTHTATTKLRTYVRGPGHVGGAAFDSTHDIGLSNFEESQAARNCENAHWGSGYQSVINSCQRTTGGAANPVLTISTTCGKRDTICCGSTQACDSGLRCTGDFVCGDCGGDGQIACVQRTGSTFDETAFCNAGLGLTQHGSTFSCGHCGGSGQVPCSSGCNSGLATWDAQPSGGQTCQPCGGNGQPYCKWGPATCASGLKGNAHYQCTTSCGGTNAYACVNFTTWAQTCNSGLAVNFDGKCVAAPTAPPVTGGPHPPVTPPSGDCGHSFEKCCSANQCFGGLFCGDTGRCGTNPPGLCNAPDEECCHQMGTSESTCSNTFYPQLDTRCTSGASCKLR